MGSNMYSPADNYERNLLMVKRFGGRYFMLLIPIFMLMKIVCIGYLSVTKNELMEITLVRLLFTKISPDISFQTVESIIMLTACIVSLYFIIVFSLFHMTSKDPSGEAVPKTSLSMAHKWSVAQIVLLTVIFAVGIIFIVLFTVKGPGYFVHLGDFFNLTVSQMESYSVTIIVSAVITELILGMSIWFSQSQAEFIKSIELTLKSSVAKNKGAHTYGVFSMAIALGMLGMAGVMTFLYYCYKDALNGFGISMETSYVFVSLALAYIRGLIPFLIAICAFTYSETVDEANSVGTLYYNHIETIGEVVDPNMHRKTTRKYD